MKTTEENSLSVPDDFPNWDTGLRTGSISRGQSCVLGSPDVDS